MPKSVCLLAAALMLVGGAATAHSWYPKECCHDRDCRPVPCSELKYQDDHVIWKDKVYFDRKIVHLSPDQACHVCVREHQGFMPYVPEYIFPLCVFVPEATS